MYVGTGLLTNGQDEQRLTSTARTCSSLINTTSLTLLLVIYHQFIRCQSATMVTTLFEALMVYQFVRIFFYFVAVLCRIQLWASRNITFPTAALTACWVRQWGKKNNLMPTTGSASHN